MSLGSILGSFLMCCFGRYLDVFGGRMLYPFFWFGRGVFYVGDLLFRGDSPEDSASRWILVALPVSIAISGSGCQNIDIRLGITKS